MKDGAPLRHCSRLAKGNDEYQGEKGQQKGRRDFRSDAGHLRVVGDHPLPCELLPERARPFFQQ